MGKTAVKEAPGEAIVADEKSQAAEKMLEYLRDNQISLSQFLETMGLEAVSKADAKPRVARKAIQEEYALATTSLAGEDLEIVGTLVEVIDRAAEAIRGEGDFEGDEAVDEIALCLKRMRKVEDINKGRLLGIRARVFDALDARVGEGQPGSIVSLRERYKMERIVPEPKGELDTQSLAEAVGNDVWRSLTSPSCRCGHVKGIHREGKGSCMDPSVCDCQLYGPPRSLDPAKLEKALKQGKVTIAQIQEATVVRQAPTRFVPRDLPAAKS